MMESDSPIKNILYGVISRITESKIQTELANKNSQKIIKEILDLAIPQLSELRGNRYENLGAFAESFAHYLLTNALIPSQRKITIRDIEIDIIIPDSRALDHDALIIYFTKTSDQNLITDVLGRLSKIQPKKENILIVSESAIPPHRTYGIQNYTFTKIIDDLSQFIASKPQSKFKILRT